ncbi:MAG: alpha/beta hydrolase [Bacteroidota bacterium]
MMHDSFLVKMSVILLLSLVLGKSAFCQSRYVSLDSTRIWINTIGIEDRKEGEPLIIFESGHGTPMGNWDKVIEGVAELAPLLTYERPGVGNSDTIEEMPTIENVSDRLVRLLNHLELEPPYVLVGHSLGGLYVRGFANHYPEMLAGLIIVDPADFTETHQNKRVYYEVLDWEEAKVDSLIEVFVERRRLGHEKSPGPIKREGQVLETLREAEFQEINEKSLPNIPVHILVGGRFDMPAKFHSKEYDAEALFRSKIKHRLWRWTDVIQSVDKGMIFYSADAGHYVHWDDPELLISSVRIVLQDYESIRQKE